MEGVGTVFELLAVFNNTAVLIALSKLHEMGMLDPDELGTIYDGLARIEDAAHDIADREIRSAVLGMVDGMAEMLPSR